VKAAIEQHPAMVYKNQTDGCMPKLHNKESADTLEA
jgi:hypothetical protein